MTEFGDYHSFSPTFPDKPPDCLLPKCQIYDIFFEWYENIKPIRCETDLFHYRGEWGQYIICNRLRKAKVMKPSFYKKTSGYFLCGAWSNLWNAWADYRTGKIGQSTENHSAKTACYMGKFKQIWQHLPRNYQMRRLWKCHTCSTHTIEARMVQESCLRIFRNMQDRR